MENYDSRQQDNGFSAPQPQDVITEDTRQAASQEQQGFTSGSEYEPYISASIGEVLRGDNGLENWISTSLREVVESGKNADAQSDYDQYLRDLVNRGFNGDLEGGHGPEGGHEPGFIPGSEYDPGFIPSSEYDATVATILKALKGDTNGDLGGDHHDPVRDVAGRVLDGVAGRVLDGDPEDGYEPEDGYGLEGGYGPDGGYYPEGGYDPEGGYYPDDGYGFEGGYDPEGGYSSEDGYGLEGGYGSEGGYYPEGGYSLEGGYDSQSGYDFDTII
jgi:hypothetical protein